MTPEQNREQALSRNTRQRQNNSQRNQQDAENVLADDLRGIEAPDEVRDQNFVLRFLLKWSAGSLTRINETIARLKRKDPTKMRAPMSTLRQVKRQNKFRE